MIGEVNVIQTQKEGGGDCVVFVEATSTGHLFG